MLVNPALRSCCGCNMYAGAQAKKLRKHGTDGSRDGRDANAHWEKRGNAPDLRERSGGMGKEFLVEEGTPRSLRPHFKLQALWHQVCWASAVAPTLLEACSTRGCCLLACCHRHSTCPAEPQLSSACCRLHLQRCLGSVFPLGCHRQAQEHTGSHPWAPLHRLPSRRRAQ